MSRFTSAPRPTSVRPAIRKFLAALVALLALVASTPTEAATVRGTVTDPDKRPVPGARLTLVAAGFGPRSTWSSRDGSFRLDEVPAGSYDLVASIDGFSAPMVRLDLSADADRFVAVQLRISALSESVVVTAAQVELPLARATDSVTVLTRETLSSRQITSVSDALGLVPGLGVARSGGPGGNVSVFTRGGESDYTLVLIDGVKANAIGGGFDFSELFTDDIDRIEVVRGPQSAVFGADAIGGVIHLVTRQGGRPGARGSIETGGLGTRRVSFGTTGSAGRWSYGASAHEQRSDGFAGRLIGNMERVGNDDSVFRGASANIRRQSAAGADIQLNARASLSDRGYPGPFGSNPIGAFPGVDRLSRGHGLTYQAGTRVSLPAMWRGRGMRHLLQAGFLRSTTDYRSLYGLSESASHRLTFKAQSDLAVSRAVGLSAGAELQREEATSTFITGMGTEPVPVRRLVAGYFGEARYQRARRFSLAAGLRIDQIRRDRLEASPNPYTPRPSFGAETVVSVNPRLSAGLIVRSGATDDGRAGRLFSTTRIRAAAGTGIRPPDALEIAFTDNPALKPERSQSAEVAVEQGLAGEAGRLEVTAFTNRYDDLIVAVGPAFADRSRYRTDNIANAGASGVEVGLGARTRWGLDVRASYTWLRSRVEAVDGAPGTAPSPFAVGDWLLRRPRHQGSLDVAIRRARFAVFGQVGARGRLLDVEPNWGAYGGLFRNPGFAVVNAGFSVRLVSGLELVGRVANLLDRRYEEALGYPAPGRTGTIGVRVAVGK